MVRRAAKADANQPEVVEALRAAGAEVQHLHMVGDGCADILVAFRGVWYVIEIKDGSKPPSKQKLTQAEARWHERFEKQAPTWICNSAESALRAIGAIS